MYGYGFLPSHRASLAFGQCQIILLSNRYVCEQLVQSYCTSVRWPAGTVENEKWLVFHGSLFAIPMQCSMRDKVCITIYRIPC